MTAMLLASSHPIHAALASLEDAASEVSGFNPVFLSPGDKAAALVTLTRIESQVAAARMQILAVAADVSDRDGTKDPGAWLSSHALVDAKTAHAIWRLAGEVAGREALAEAMRAGAVTADHARVITRALEDLADDLDAESLAAAEATLIEYATRFRPAELRRLAAHLLDVVVPELAEAAEAKRLLDLEEEAEKKTRLTIKPTGDGTTKVYGTVPDHVGVRLRTMVEAYAQPRIAALDADGRVRPRSRIMGEAFGAMLEAMDTDRVPLHGGDATTVIVTVPLDHLHKELAAAAIEGADGAKLSAAEARRLACTAKIIPAVLGGPSEPLDLGRTRRLFTAAQRKALKLRDGGCRAEGCTVPATWCDAHHDQPWSHRGPTDLTNALLLCGHHHRRAHDPHYDATRLPDGTVRFHRRP